MANSAQARKRVRQNEKHRANQRSQRSRAGTAVKAVRAAQSPEGMDVLLRAAFSKLDKLASKRIMSRNTAARLKQRLHAHAKRVGAPA